MVALKGSKDVFSTVHVESISLNVWLYNVKDSDKWLGIKVAAPLFKPEIRLLAKQPSSETYEPIR